MILLDNLPALVNLSYFQQPVPTQASRRIGCSWNGPKNLKEHSDPCPFEQFRLLWQLFSMSTMGSSDSLALSDVTDIFISFLCVLDGEIVSLLFINHNMV